MKVDLAKDKLLSFLFQHKVIVGWIVESKVVFPKPAKKCSDFLKFPQKHSPTLNFKRRNRKT